MIKVTEDDSLYSGDDIVIPVDGNFSTITDVCIGIQYDDFYYLAYTDSDGNRQYSDEICRDYLEEIITDYLYKQSTEDLYYTTVEDIIWMVTDWLMPNNATEDVEYAIKYFVDFIFENVYTEEEVERLIENEQDEVKDSDDWKYISRYEYMADQADLARHDIN